MSLSILSAARPAGFWPWQDRAGAFSGLRAGACLGLLLPAGLALADYAFGMTGSEPLKALLREIGTWSIRLLLVALLVRPLRVLLDWPRITLLRRLLGLGAFCYLAVHFALYLPFENWRLLKVAAELVQRFYLTIGVVALLGLAALAWTSTDAWVRRLGARRWQALHRLAYPLTALGLLHFFIQSRADVTEPVITAGCFLWLMGWRLLPRRWQGQPLALLLLAPLAGLATAGVEYAWYALATGLPAARILAANLDVEFGFRPAVWVLCVGLGLAALAALRGLGRRLAAFSAAPAAARATAAPARKPAGAASSPG